MTHLATQLVLLALGCMGAGCSLGGLSDGQRSADAGATGDAGPASAITVLATDEPEVSELLVTGLSLFWVNGGRQGSIGGCTLASCAGEKRKIASAQGAPQGLTADGETIAWVNNADATVMAQPKEGPALAVATAQLSPSGVSLRGDRAYWLNASCKAGGSPPCLATAKLGAPGASVVLDQYDAGRLLRRSGAELYWFDSNTKGGILRALRLTGDTSSDNVRELAAIGEDIVALEIDTADAYVVTRAKGTIASVDRQAKGATPTVQAQLGAPALAATSDTDALYVLLRRDGQPRATVARCVKKAPATCDEYQLPDLDPSALAVDGASLYVADRPSQRILRMPKVCGGGATCRSFAARTSP
jgi:hypothetical protein